MLKASAKKSNSKMLGMIGLISLAFSGAIGVTLLFLACALPQYNLWWPIFVLFFYILAPIPTMLVKKSDSGNFDKPTGADMSIFLTMAFVVSSFGLPTVLLRTNTIQTGAFLLTISGNILVFLTFLGYFVFADAEDDIFRI